MVELKIENKKTSIHETKNGIMAKDATLKNIGMITSLLGFPIILRHPIKIPIKQKNEIKRYEEGTLNIPNKAIKYRTVNILIMI